MFGFPVRSGSRHDEKAVLAVFRAVRLLPVLHLKTAY